MSISRKTFFLVFTLATTLLCQGAYALSMLSSKPPEIYPLSRKASQLIQTSNDFPTASTKISPIGWSNRLGSVLTPVSIPGVYTADRPFYWNRIDVGCRMTVIVCSLDTNSARHQLFIHSPVSLDDKLIQAIEALGEVKWVVSPNYEHVKYAKEWSERFPQATMIACPGLMEREPDVYNVEIPFGIRPGDNAPGLWDMAEIQALHVDCEINPFTGRAFFNEVVFFHIPSKTLLVTDTYWNYPGSVITNENYSCLPGGSASPLTTENDEEERDFGVWQLAPEIDEIPFGTKAWKFGMDKIYRPFYLNLMIKEDQRFTFSEIVKQIVEKWEVETLIPAHGDIVRGVSLVRRILRDHFVA
eukprot:CAMPEP_0196814744 /NCGR_PEP_ID=MMETSP1362-20130617/45463_1 /TAXON_ID=163516 /ORGANISM="Leptocylindrus danicus, Strain CCMP1856" /LENGTH=356 /DNA_ID=CAMNT_0042191465 /DNA_START=170 /DNA_END=1240 /DNA_ORIENTATION=-